MPLISHPHQQTVRALLRAVQDAKLGWRVVVLVVQPMEAQGKVPVRLPVIGVRLEDESETVVLTIGEEDLL